MSAAMRSGRSSPHGRGFPRRLAQADRRLRLARPWGKDGWSKIWTGNNWYQPYQDASVGVPVYFPDMNIGGQGFGGGGFYWNQKPEGEGVQRQDLAAARLALPEGRVRAAAQLRLTYVSSTSNFYFPPRSRRRRSTIPTRCTTAISSRRSCWARSTALRR